jgi:mRNA-degrading endonuclease YafQ of YafQ-DinJ toxin-antitoxin module
MRIETTKSLLRSLRRRTDDELKAVANVMQSAAATFGRPHLHTGIDIRRLGKNHFECRVGLDLRLVFKSERDALVFVLAGDHNEVRAYLKNTS